MLNGLIRAAAASLIRLRYRVRVVGLEAVARRGVTGILFLPNHPALIDPVIVMTRLYSRFRPRPLADRDQVDRPVVRWAAARMRALTIPDPLIYGDDCRAEVEQGIERCAAALRGGENLLIYPAGHIMRQREENLAAASAVETLLRRVPEARVVLVRTRGLWGSAFSRASGTAPRLSTVLPKAARALLLNGLFFAPRRAVTLELVEPDDLPRAAGRAELNRYLESFYNRDAPPNTHVPYTVWERGGTRTQPEPAAEASRAETDEVPVATRDQVLQHLRTLTGRPVIRDDDSLARNLNLDSLAVVELALWLEKEFGFAVGDGTGLETVRDVLLAARGTVVAAAPVALRPVPRRWFAARVPAGPRTGRAGIPDGTTLTGVFLRQAAAHPGRVILADQGSGVRTYRDLITAILTLRPAIERLPGDCVGIMLPASVAAGCAVLAVMFAGKTPVMINWTVGVRNMAHALDLLQVGGVLTSSRVVRKIESQAGGLGDLRTRFVMLEDLVRDAGRLRQLRAWLAARIGGCRRLGARSVRSEAVVLFTSGSESLPKAVPLTHANLLANLRDLCAVFPFTRDDRLIGILPPFHSFGLTATVLLPLCTGVPVVYHPNPTEGSMLARLIEAYRVTLLVGTPTFLNGILRCVRGRELVTLRAVISGAEKCPDAVRDLIRRRWPGLSVIEGYGITECSPVVSLEDPARPRPGTIGRPLPSVAHAVVDLDTGRRVARGKTGMLLVRGPSVFGGYRNDTGTSPFTEFEGRTWYRTGDLVAEGEDGTLTFVGRLKRFVKLGGEMISLPAIEAALATHYVTAADDEPVLAVEATPVEPNPELVLFTTRDLDRDEVNRRLRDAGLSALYSIRVIRRIDRIPTLGTGKTDYRALKGMLSKETENRERSQT